MELIAQPMDGRFVRLEPFEVRSKEEVLKAIDCDPETWAIMAVDPTGDPFEQYWSVARGAPPTDRIAFAVRRCSDGRVVGMSSLYASLASQGGFKIGTTFLHPDVRGGPVNAEAKLMMLDHAFSLGAVRVQFRVDTRNQRSLTAVAKLGIVREGVLRCDRMTWSGYIRDTVYFSILDWELPDVKFRLQQGLAESS